MQPVGTDGCQQARAMVTETLMVAMVRKSMPRRSQPLPAPKQVAYLRPKYRNLNGNCGGFGPFCKVRQFAQGITESSRQGFGKSPNHLC